MGQRGRPSQQRAQHPASRWDKYFMDLCKSISAKSPCFSRKVGAVLVWENVILSTGYNGPPKAVPHCGAERLEVDGYLRDEISKTIDPTFISTKERCPRRVMSYPSGEGLRFCPAVHAEVNCVASAAWKGVVTSPSTLYLNDQLPCKACMGVLVNAGVVEIVCTNLEPYDELALFISRNIYIRDMDGRALNREMNWRDGDPSTTNG